MHFYIYKMLWSIIKLYHIERNCASTMKITQPGTELWLSLHSLIEMETETIIK